MRKILLDEDSGAPDKFIPDEEVTPEIAKKLYYRCIRKNKSHNKASKPTQAQCLCGLSNCYVDHATNIAEWVEFSITGMHGEYEGGSFELEVYLQNLESRYILKERKCPIHLVVSTFV